RSRAYARIGLIGNPSDGYFGKTISCCIRNFSAEVTLWESPTLQITPNPQHDPTEFESLHQLQEIAKRDGYYGGIRLLFATCKKFKEYCDLRGLDLPQRNFTLSYDTDIPRQVGLGGSSAIIVALFHCLMEFYSITESHIPLPVQPNIILSVERQELEITAGLQDRVIQVYGGTVFMDFNRELMERQHYGDYLRMDSRRLPPLFLAYSDNGSSSYPGSSESGRILSNLRFRYESGDPEVLKAIESWAGLADDARGAIEGGETRRLGELMNANFDLRRKVIGETALGADNLRMIQIARDLGHPAKFSGSGGAIVGIYQTDEEFNLLQKSYESEGYKCVRVEVDGGNA
ncbi:MAG: hypothetical protein HY318_19670, partial [Armatimonadetes bacterium]|nr:hypothetical protein [Armatimonadota bacterium]